MTAGFTVRDKLRELGESTDERRWAELRRLADVLALKRLPGGRFTAGHWWRGPLLYSLIRHYRPRHVLEFGTGRGYGAVCMARAAVDAGLDTTIWTVDVVPPNRAQAWALDEGDGPTMVRRALAEAWRRHVAPHLRERIRLVTGSSADAARLFRRVGLPCVDFCFIDGGHDYATARHDFTTALAKAAPGCAFLFDDYTDRPGYGVKRLVDGDLRGRLPEPAIEVIATESVDSTPDGHVTHEMALVRGECLGAAAPATFYTPFDQARFAMLYELRHAGRTAAGRLRAAAASLVRRQAHDGPGAG